MKRFPFALRWSIPGMLLLLGSTLSLFTFHRQVAYSHSQTEKDMLRQVRKVGDQTSGILEYLLLFRQTDKTAANLVITKLSSNPNLTLAMVYDEANEVILSNHYELRTQPIGLTPAARFGAEVNSVRQSRSSKIMLSTDRQSIQALYPVTLGATADQIRPSRVGVLFLSYDLKAIKQRSFNYALEHSLESSGVLMLLCSAVGVFFYRTLTLRVAQLVKAAYRLANGELDVRAGLQGSDELAQISTAFDQMAGQIQASQTQLQKLSQQREELLNLLASQIRNSFDLDVILSTAVEETQRFLGVDRCNFVWYHLEAAEAFVELTHEAKQVGVPNLLGQFPIPVADLPNFQQMVEQPYTLFNDLSQPDFSQSEGQNAEMQKVLASNGFRSFLGCPIKTRSGKMGMLAGIYHDVAHVWSANEVELLRGVANQVEIAIDQAELYEQTHHQALHDRLTGLPNRMLLDDRLVRAIAEAQRHQRRLAVMFMDVDRFKVINDTLGHACGDLLLQEIAQRVLTCVRDVDTVARWGGDEFVILLPQIQRPTDGVMVAQRVLTALKPIFEIEDHFLHISSSIGIATYPEDGKDAETLLKNADAALYQAKAKGRNTYECYAPTIHAPSSDVLTIETSLYQALENQELILHYQPQVNIETWEITGVEALVRWQHPELGLVPPGVFIPIAEANGLIVPIGEWVLQTACAQAKIWQTKMPSLKIAVNLSARQFQQPNLVGLVTNVLRETALPPSSLELEITESTVMHDVAFARSTFTAFQDMGIHLSMDDFGTGYSSLSYLKQYPLHTIKIDRSFIQELPHNPYDQAIVTAVVAISKSLNLRVVAEGVETQEQLHCLQNLGCDVIQGYFFSRPLPVQGITDLIEAGTVQIAT